MIKTLKLLPIAIAAIALCAAPLSEAKGHKSGKAKTTHTKSFPSKAPKGTK